MKQMECPAAEAGIVVVVRLARLVRFQFGNDLLDVPARSLALQGEQEQLPLVYVQLRGQIDHHLPQQIGVAR